jgi:hypothetical protein
LDKTTHHQLSSVVCVHSTIPFLNNSVLLKIIQELLTLRKPRIFRCVLVVLYQVNCFVLFVFFVSFCVMCAQCLSRLSIPDYPFDFLWRLRCVRHHLFLNKKLIGLTSNSKWYIGVYYFPLLMFWVLCNVQSMKSNYFNSCIYSYAHF